MWFVSYSVNLSGFEKKVVGLGLGSGVSGRGVWVSGVLAWDSLACMYMCISLSLSIYIYIIYIYIYIPGSSE